MLDLDLAPSPAAWPHIAVLDDLGVRQFLLQDAVTAGTTGYATVCRISASSVAEGAASLIEIEIEGDGTWPYGLRPEAAWIPAFTQELRAITTEAPCEANPDGSVPLGASDKKLLLEEIIRLMKRAQRGTVRALDFEEVRSGDIVVELKHPRPGNLGGWHYRVYTGIPPHPRDDHVVWLGAGRKPDSEYDPEGWSELQTGQIETSHCRYKVWLISQLADKV